MGQPGADGPVILQVLPSLVTGGAERGCIDVAVATVAAGGTALVASSGGPMERELARGGARHITLPLDTKNPLGIRRNVARLEAVIEAHGVHLVHARSRAPAWSAYFACRRRGIPFLTTFHAAYNQRSAVKRLYNSVMVRGDLVIAISAYIGRHVQEVYGVDPARVRVIPRGIDIDRFAPERVSAERVIQLARRWRLPDDAKVVLMPARLTRWKGHEVLLDALARLGRRDIRCLLVGGDQGRAAYRRSLEAKVRTLGLDGVVHIADQCDDMPAAYKLSDVVVHASVEPEGFGRTIVEALAMGRPVVASDLGAPPELIHAEAGGWLTRPGDPDSLAAALDRALGLDQAAREAASERAIAHVRANYALERMTQATIAVYEELLTGAGAGRAAAGAIG